MKSKALAPVQPLTPTPNRGGRPSKYSLELADSICERLAHGESLVKICRDEDMPSDTTIYRWLHEKSDFLGQYEHARELQAEHYAQEIVDIADEMPLHEVPTADGGTSTRIDPAGVQRNRLRVDARKWIAAKLLPKKYGDRISQQISGPDGGSMPLSLIVDL